MSDITSNNTESGRVIWFAKVTDVDDPLMLNRIRVQFETKNNEAILKSIPDTRNGRPTKTDSGNDLLPEWKWSEIDSFCCLPLLPIFLSVKPKKDESVNIIFPNSEYKFNEQYYIPGIFSSPLTAYRDNFNAQRMFAAKNRLKSPMLLKNPTNNEYYISKTKGVFIEPNDVGMIGRGTCDLVLKDRDVLIRAGKSTTIPDNSNKEIRANTSRSFIQLSDFTQRETPLPPIESLRLQQTVSYVQMLIEWNVINPENEFDLFNYEITLYRLPQKSGYTTQNLQVDSNVDNNDKALVFKVSFNSESMEKMVERINNFILQTNEGEINLPPFPILELSNQFPLFFRPSPETYAKLNSPELGIVFSNLTEIAAGIKYKSQKRGYGLIFTKNKTGQQFNLVKDVQEQKEINNESPITYGIMGADRVVILSHESRVPSKKKINLGEDTIYGIDQAFIAANILQNTDPMVRGDELMKFLNLVVRFLISHVHPFPGLPPVPVATDGTSASDILQQLSTASDTILNQNIRIN